jgi:hypothetical protein
MMKAISKKDREVLRELAKHHLELANSKENEKILKKWKFIERGKIGEPTVRFLVSNFTNETITPRLKCEGANARDLEFSLLLSSAGRELFNDDTPITGEFLVHQSLWVTPFGTSAKRTVAEGENAKGYHIEPVI